MKRTKDKSTEQGRSEEVKSGELYTFKRKASQIVRQSDSKKRIVRYQEEEKSRQ